MTAAVHHLRYEMPQNGFLVAFELRDRFTSLNPGFYILTRPPNWCKYEDTTKHTLSTYSKARTSRPPLCYKGKMIPLTWI